MGDLVRYFQGVIRPRGAVMHPWQHTALMVALGVVSALTVALLIWMLAQ